MAFKRVIVLIQDGVAAQLKTSAIVYLKVIRQFEKMV